MRFLTLLAAAALLAGAHLAPTAAAQTCSTSWTNAAGGVWTDGANWDNGVPTAASDACIVLDGTYTVTLDVTVTVASLTLGTAAGAGAQTLLNTNRTLSLTAPSTILATGVYDWQGGITGGGSTLTNDGLIAISSAANKDIGPNTTLRNQALTTFDGTGVLRFLGGGPSTFVNAASGTFDILSDADFTVSNGGNVFTNDGLFRKSGGADASVVSFVNTLSFSNSGTVEAQTGAIRFSGNGTHTDGVFTAAAGAELHFDAGTHTVVGTMTGVPDGVIRLDAGATLTGGAGATLAVLGSGFEWQGGTLTGALTNTGLLRLTTGATKDLGANAALTNTSLVEMTDAGTLRFLGGGPSTFVNAVGATFDMQSDADFTFFNAGNVFANNGLFRKSGGTDASVISPSAAAVVFDNNGTLDAQTGTLRFDGNGTHTDGAFTAAAGAEVFFNAGTHTVVGTMTGAPDGVLRLDAGATLTGGAGATLAVLGSGFEWQSGTFAGVLTNTGLLRLTTSGLKDLGANAALTNTSLVEMTDLGGLRFVGGGPSTFVNAAGATFDMQSDADFTFFNVGNVFTNDGLFQKTGGTDASVISPSATAVVFDNNGTLDAQTGTLRFDGNGTHTDGVFTASAGAEIYFNVGAQTIVGTMTGAPEGLIRLDVPASLSGGTLALGGSGFEWQSGNFGTLTNAGLLRLTTNGLKDLSAGATLTNTSLVEMTDLGNLRFVGSGPSTFVNAAGATFDMQSDADFTFFNAGNVFANSGLFRKSGGTGASVISPSATTVSFMNAAGGVVSAESGTLDVNGVFDHAAGALVQGTATFDIAGATFTHDGATGPGTSPGVLEWNGAWAPAATSALRIEIGGSTPGTDYDQLIVQGSATLDGDLVLTLADGGTPTTGDSYTVLTAAAAAGTFANVIGPDGYVFDVVYGGSDVVVTITAVGVSAAFTGAEGWRMIAPSVTEQTFDGLLGDRWTQGFPGSDVPGFGTPNVYTYDETAAGDAQQGYVAPGDQADGVALGRGVFAYIYADDDLDGPMMPGFPKDFSQSGTDVAGAFPFAVDYTADSGPDEDGWNLLGNPYAASLDWMDPAWTRTGTDATLYVWDPTSGQYLTHDTVTGSLPGGLVAPAQGFWVQTTAASPDLTAPASARTTGGAFAGRTTEALVTELRVRRASDADGTRAASAHVVLADGAADGRDALDAFELTSLASDALGLWTARLSDDTALDIQALAPAESREIPVGVAAWADGAPADAALVLTWPQLPDGVTATLRDEVTGEILDLGTATEYAFTLDASETAGTTPSTPDAFAAPPRQRADGARFTLRLGGAFVADEGDAPSFATELLAPAPNPTRGATTLRYTVAEAGPVTVTVHDLLGRTVATLAGGEAAAGEHRTRLDTSGLAAGVYVVRMAAPGFSGVQRLTVVR